MNKELKKEIEELIEGEGLDCSVNEFEDTVDWHLLYNHSGAKVSESFMENFIDHIDWFSISISQKLSQSFIHRHRDKVYWPCISDCQKLSDSFIKKHKGEIDWNRLPKDQQYLRPISKEDKKEDIKEGIKKSLKDFWKHKTVMDCIEIK